MSYTVNNEISCTMRFFISKLYMIKRCIKDDTVITRWDIIALSDARARIKSYFNDYQKYFFSSDHSIRCSEYHDIWMDKSIYQYWEDAIRSIGNNKFEKIPLDDIMDDKFFNEILDELHDIRNDHTYY